MFAQNARMAATEAAGAAAAGDGMKALAAANTMAAQCKQCHGMYREGDAQTGFHIKPGVITQ
jgi:cytochrome c553